MIFFYTKYEATSKAVWASSDERKFLKEVIEEADPPFALFCEMAELSDLNR